jgi:hypothetical protein
MKNKTILLAVTVLAVIFACRKEESARFRLLTGPVWTTDSLLANGVDAGGPGGFLAKFKGDAKFNKDGTGYFGAYKGTWMFSGDERQIVIASDSLAIPIVTNIAELTSASLKVTAEVPNPLNLFESVDIRLTFKPK